MAAEQALSEDEMQARIQKAAEEVKSATALLFTSGAGMGVDSGLPDFRGPEGFWKAYPPMKDLNLKFHEMSTPSWFERNPQFAWGFWGHRFKLYANAVPHEGFHVCKRLGESKLPTGGYFVFTSNVDGEYQKAGFPEDRIYECHGSVNWMQCTKRCSKEIWSSDAVEVNFNETTFQAEGELPKCKFNPDHIARPHVLMFNDYGYMPEIRNFVQEARLAKWYKDIKNTPNHKLVIIEVGAGTAVPTVRREGERAKGTLIRINLRDTDAPRGSVVIPLGGKDALERIEKAVLQL